jgi:hypothetical protein
MNAAGAAILITLILVIVTGSRLYALLALVAGAMFLTQAQAVQAMGLNMFAVRWLEIVGFIRVMSRREFSFSNLNKIDRALLWLYLFIPIVYCFRSTEGQAYIIGESVDAFLCYFTFRGLVRDMEDMREFLRAFILLLAPYAVMILYEVITHKNAFAFIGGGMWDWVRGDRFRCVGSFRNPDLLGTLGATFAPLYVGLACSRDERKRAIFGLALCLFIVWASNSGGPICAAAVGFFGWGLWFIRTRMQTVRRAMAATLILLAIVMKAPIWYLLARVSEFTGGDGWHRAYLIDVSVQHLSLWWFAGLPTVETSDWFEYSFSTGADITNNFISVGLSAGLGAIVLLIVLLVRGFSNVGNALVSIQKDLYEPTPNEFLLWGFGAMLAAHIANWLGITYFDQSYVIFFMQLAALASVTASCIATAQDGVAPVENLPVEIDHVEPAMQFEQEPR